MSQLRLGKNSSDELALGHHLLTFPDRQADEKSGDEEGEFSLLRSQCPPGKRPGLKLAHEMHCFHQTGDRGRGAASRELPPTMQSSDREMIVLSRRSVSPVRAAPRRCNLERTSRGFPGATKTRDWRFRRRYASRNADGASEVQFDSRVSALQPEHSGLLRMEGKERINPKLARVADPHISMRFAIV